MSAPTLEHAPSSIEHLDQLSQADLLERRGQIDAQLDTYDTELHDQFKKLEESNDPQISIIDQLLVDQESDANISEVVSSYSYMIKHGESLLSPELLGTFKKIDDLDRDEDELVAQLDTRFAPGLMQYARDEALEIYSNLDYVAAGKLEKGASPDLPDSDGIQLRINEQTLPHPEEVAAKLRDIAYAEHANLNYRYAEMQVDEIERCKQILERWGVGTKQPLPKPVYDHTELERAEELNTRYRNYHNQFSAISAESKPLLPIHEWAVNLPDAEAENYYDHLASIDLEKELERIKVDGLELLPFDFSEAELRDYIRSNIPAIALEGLNNIVFRNATEKEIERDSRSNTFNGKGVTLAHHSHDLSENSADIVVFVDRYQKSHDDLILKDPNKLFVDWIVKNQVLDTVAHELAHALHHTLPVSILHEWDQVASDEKVEVTGYVSEMNKLDHNHRYMEDFADSFSLYVNDPRELSTLAGKRYAMMRAIVTKLKPTT
ncbi:MAG: hypothetical protein ABIR46_03835 [Candidatus Saccharimonadales bacterium]